MKSYYLFEISYIGLNYFGWQKQKQFATIQGEIEKALKELCNSEKIKTFGASRTDSKVSALSNFFRASLPSPFETLVLKSKLNHLLPQDIRVLNVKETTKNFLVSKSSKAKEYLYQFSFDDLSEEQLKFITPLDKQIDIDKMMAGCSLFIGEHSFHNYQYRGTTKNKVRTIIECEIIPTPLINFSPENKKVYTLRIKGNGFLKQMVRIIMGTLIELGENKISQDQILDSLDVESNLKLGHIAPGNALFLHYIEY